MEIADVSNTLGCISNEFKNRIPITLIIRFESVGDLIDDNVRKLPIFARYGLDCCCNFLGYLGDSILKQAAVQEVWYAYMTLN